MRSSLRFLAALTCFFLLVWAFAAPVALRAASSGDFTYTVSNNEVTITGYTGIGGAVSVPDQIAGLPITRLGTSSFENRTAIRSITLPPGVTIIGDDAFSNCSSLTQVTLPSGLTSMGAWAFSGCSSLTSIALPSGLTSVSPYTFHRCTSLVSVTLPTGLTFIDYDAFSECSSLAQITLPSGLTFLGAWAFDGCSSLTDITLPSGLASVSPSTFRQCTSLANVTLPSGLTSIGDEAFSDCSSLTSINLPPSLTSIGDEAFFNCSSLIQITLPSGLTSIGESAFFSCTNLSVVRIPVSVSTVGEAPFRFCTRLKAIHVDPANPAYASADGVLFDKAFQTLLQAPGALAGAYEVPFGVTTVSAYAFSLCSELTQLSFPATVTSLGRFAAGACPRLTSVSFSGNAPAAEFGVFQYSHPDLILYRQPDSEGFTSPVWLGLPCYLRDGEFAYFVENGAATVGAYTGTASNVVIPDELGGLPVARIGAKAFYHCDSLTSVVFPVDLTSIGDSAFADCASLSAVRFAGTAPTLGVSVFDSVAAGFAVHYPQGTSGFTSPVWSGYPARAFNSAQSFINFPALPARRAGTRFSLKASASSGLPVSFLVVSGPATLGADGKTITVGPAAGTVTIRALQPGGVRKGIAYAAATPVQRTFEVTPTPATQAQSITFAQPPAATYGDAPVTLAANASSGLPVSLELIASAPAGIANLVGDSSLAILGAGRIIVKATQAGSGTYKAAKPVLRVVTINKAPLAVSFHPVTRLVGQATGVAFEPVFGAEADGGSTLHDFVRGDSTADLAESRPSGRSRATNTSPPGQYPISAIGGSDANYRFVAGQPAHLTLVGFGGGYEVLLVGEDHYPRGKLSVLVAYNSLAFSGVLELTSKPAAIPIRGTLLATDGSAATGSWTRPASDGVAPLALSFTINNETGYLLPGLTSGQDIISPALYYGPTRVFVQERNGETKQPSPWTGSYTSVHLSIEGLGAGAHSGTPGGAGHAWVSVAANGTMTIKGKLGDGTLLTTSSPCSEWRDDAGDRKAIYRIFARPYGRRLDSLVSGEHELSANLGRGERGWMSWQKAPSPTKPADSSYREGFKTLRWATIERWQAPSANPAVIHGNVVPAATLVQRLLPGADSGDSAVLAIDFTDRAAFGARANLIPSSFKLASSGRISDLLPATTPANVSGFTLSITPATGAFAGSFLLSDLVAPPPAKPVTRKAIFSGSLFQNPTASFLGYGHVLLDPVPGDTGADADALVSHEIILLNAQAEE